MKQRPSTQELPTLARFRVLREIGSGSQGQVYEVIDLDRNVRLALKTLRMLEPHEIVRFKAEFRAVRDLRHPNLVTLGELIEEDGRWYFTMELVDGVDFIGYVRRKKTLEESTSWPARDESGSRTRIDTRLRRAGARIEVEPAPPPSTRIRGTFDEDRLRETMRQLVTGLAFLHRSGKIHRDLKPSNVLVDRHGRVVLIDFGVAFELFAADGEDGQVVGTVPYMAPEQALGESVGPAADWYAVGVLLFEALTGKRPFEGPSTDVIERKCLLDAPRPSDFMLDVPRDLEDLCVRLLARDAEARPAEDEILDVLGVQADATAGSGAIFVGRDQELSALAEAEARVRNGAMVTVFLEGESGVGKSALAARFLDELRASSHKLVVLEGRCHEQERVPYNAFDAVIDALARYMRARRAALREQLLPPGMDRLRRLFPAIGLVEEPLEDELVITRGTPVPPPRGTPLPPPSPPPPPLHMRGTPVPRPSVAMPIEARAERESAFAALRELLRRVATRRPTVILVEDIQWADADSLALLEALTDPRHAPPLLLLATARMREDGSPCAAIDKVRGFVRIPIGGLSRDAAEELASRLIAQRNRSSDADIDATAILEGSHGHPMFIEELVRYLAQPHAQSGAVALDDALWERVCGLEPQTRRALTLVAAAGLPTAQGVIAEAGGLSASELAEHVSTLRSAKLVRVRGTRQDDPIEPYHDRVRESVMARVDREERARIHGALASALEARGAGAEVLFHHFAGAGDDMRAAYYAEAAAEAAASILAFDRAAALYKSALTIGVTDPAHRRRLLTVLGDRLTDAGRSKEAADSYLEASEAGVVPPEERATLLRCAAQQLLMSGHLQPGLAALRVVLGAQGFSLPSSRVVALARLGWYQMRLGSHELTWTQRPLDAIDPRAAARMDLCWSAGAGLGMVDSVRSMLFVDLGALLALESGDDGRIARALAAAAVAEASLGRKPQATRLGEACRRAAAGDGSERARFYGVLPALTYRFFIENDWRACLDDTFIAQRFWRASGHTEGWEADIIDQFACWSLDNLNRFDELRERVPAKIRAAQRAGNRFVEVNYRAQFISLYLTRDRPGDARRDVEDAIGSWRPASSDFGNQDYLALRSLTYIALYESDVAKLEAMLPRWDRYFGSLMSRVLFLRQDATWFQGAIALVRGVVARDRGDTSAFRARMREAEKAIDKLVAIAMPMGLTVANHLRAGLAMARGDEDAAREVLREALARADARSTALFGACIRMRLAPLVGGREGEVMREDAEAWMNTQSVAAPSRLAGAVLPGWPLR